MASILFPRPLRAGDRIAVTAPSDGVEAALHPRLDLALTHLRETGFVVAEGKCLRRSEGEVSGPAKERAAELTSFLTDESVSAVIPPWGGELAIQLLPLLDFDALGAHAAETGHWPWLLGYSDTSTLMFALAVRAGLATAHGPMLMELVPGQDDDVTVKWRDVLAMEHGATLMQSSSNKWQRDGGDWNDSPTVPFELDQPTRWRGMKNAQTVPGARFEGRLIGGCLDSIVHLVGTPFGDLAAFARRVAAINPRERVVLFLENAGMSPARFCRAMWQLRHAGWLDHVSGIVLGRHGAPDDPEYPFEQVLRETTSEVDVPVIWDADIGHKPPQLTLVNGARAIVTLHTGGTATLAQTLA